MLHTTRAVALVAFALAPVVVASGASAQAAEGVRIGLGVSLNPIAIADYDLEASFLPVGLGNFTVPIQVGSRVRFEPELGIFRGHSESSGGGFSGESTTQLLRYGLAVHYLFNASEGFRTYLGPRIGFVRQTSKQQSSGSSPFESKRTDTYYGLALGGEYWFASRFSLGGEVQISRIGIGDQEINGEPPSGSSDTSLISSNGVVSLKFYF